MVSKWRKFPTVIEYDTSLDIRNIEHLPRGTGAKYLEVIAGQGDEYVAVQWRRRNHNGIPSSHTLVRF